MPKISIQQNPTFKRQVDIPRVGGDAVKVTFEFKFLSRAQVAAFVDSEIEHGKEVGDYVASNGATVGELTARAEEFQVEHLKKILVGWGFDDEFNDENLRALVSSTAAAPDAIVAAFKASYQVAREGN